jgi:hypothetical protein
VELAERPDTQKVSDVVEYSPIVLGISGHLDILAEDREVLQTAIKQVFKHFQDRYRYTPVVVMSSLARGADQLAADAALSWGLAIIAPLPFPSDIYRRSSTFAGYDKDADKLDDLLSSHKVESFVVPLPMGPLEDDLEAWAEIAQDQQGRRTCYANAGGYILRHWYKRIRSRQLFGPDARRDVVDTPRSPDCGPSASFLAPLVRKAGLN